VAPLRWLYNGRRRSDCSGSGRAFGVRFDLLSQPGNQIVDGAIEGARSSPFNITMWGRFTLAWVSTVAFRFVHFRTQSW
jgi:hypothetical protein